MTNSEAKESTAWYFAGAALFAVVTSVIGAMLGQPPALWMFLFGIVFLGLPYFTWNENQVFGQRLSLGKKGRILSLFLSLVLLVASALWFLVVRPTRIQADPDLTAPANVLTLLGITCLVLGVIERISSADRRTVIHIHRQVRFFFSAVGLVLIMVAAGLYLNVQSTNPTPSNTPTPVTAAPTPTGVPTDTTLPNTPTPVTAVTTPTGVPIYGPVNGEFDSFSTPTLDFNLWNADVKIRNFFTYARFYNPTGAVVGEPWTYGFAFRNAGELDPAKSKEFTLIVSSDKVWFLYLVEGLDWNNPSSEHHFNELRRGRIERFNNTEGGSNEMSLQVTEKTGLFYVNGEFIAELDVSSNMADGNVLLALDAQYTKNATRFENFTVWQLEK
jgi:hypothetical protein